jgi:hyaluronan synthase
MQNEITKEEKDTSTLQIDSQNNTPNSYKHQLLIVSSLVLLLTATVAFIGFQPQFEEIFNERASSSWGNVILILGFVLLGIKVSFLGYLTYLYFKYCPVQSVSDEDLPTCSVIVPAYNEGHLVYHTLISLAESDFPEDKLQLIAIDDGSQDDTWQWMKKAKDELGDRVAIYQQPKNKGKRHALYRGFHLATGTVFITVDSDSVVEKDTLRNMASPFAVNKNCGAVAGNVKVLNTKKAIIPKMLEVSFAFSFEFVRSAQSVLGSVLCTPGALAAYKRDAVMQCLPEWIDQTFMGKKSTIGEDRAMTNMILKQGYHIMFQRNAKVLTNIPENYKTLHKMFTRWERSNVRENIMMSKFAFSNFREGSKLGSRILLANQWLKLVIAYPALLLMFYFMINYPLLFFTTSFVGILAFSSIQVLFYAVRHNAKEALWAYPYSMFYMFSLFWITPYAIATAGRGGWLTRGLDQKEHENERYIFTAQTSEASKAA